MTKHAHFLPFETLPVVPRGLGIVNYPIASKKLGASAFHTGISELPPGVPVLHVWNKVDQSGGRAPAALAGQPGWGLAAAGGHTATTGRDPL